MLQPFPLKPKRPGVCFVSVISLSLSLLLSSLKVEPDLTHAVSSVMELERFVDAGHDYAPSRPPPSVQAAKDKCQALEELALRQVDA